MDFDAGGRNTCAVVSGGSTYCWGPMQYGVGVPSPPDTCVTTTGTTLCAITPMLVPNAPPAVEVDASYSNACVRTVTGEVWCWGRAWVPDGPGVYSAHFYPDPVGGAVGAVGITRSNVHACLWQANGDLWCWGFNGYGQLGTGVADYGSPVAVQATVISGVAQVGVGGENLSWLGYGHTCVSLLTDGSVRCWGRNDVGQLGDGTQVDSLVPQPAAGLTNVVQIEGGEWHTCARTGTSHLFWWGSNTHGELGNGTTTNSSAPVAIP